MCVAHLVFCYRWKWHLTFPTWILQQVSGHDFRVWRRTKMPCKHQQDQDLCCCFYYVVLFPFTPSIYTLVRSNLHALQQPVAAPYSRLKPYLWIWTVTSDSDSLEIKSQTLIPRLLTHSTTHRVKCSSLYSLNRRYHRGSSSHQIDTSQQKTTSDCMLTYQPIDCPDMDATDYLPENILLVKCVM